MQNFKHRASSPIFSPSSSSRAGGRLGGTSLHLNLALPLAIVNCLWYLQAFLRFCCFRKHYISRSSYVSAIRNVCLISIWCFIHGVLKSEYFDKYMIAKAVKADLFSTNFTRLTLKQKRTSIFKIQVDINGRHHELDLIWFDFWCLTPISAIFQLFHGDQF